MSEGKRILIVDDDAALRAKLRAVLEAAAYEVIEATDGHDALARLRDGPTPDLVLMDMAMPREGGSEFLAALVTRTEPAPALVVTDYNHGKTPDKTVEANELLHQVDWHLKEKERQSGEFARPEKLPDGPKREGLVRGEGLACLAACLVFAAGVWLAVELLVAARVAAMPATRVVVVPQVEYRMAPTLFDVGGPVSVTPGAQVQQFLAKQIADQNAETERLLRKRHAGLQ